MSSSSTQASATQAAFYYQNVFAAHEVLGLLDPAAGIETVIVEMEAAPHIDDVVVFQAQRGIYYQVKYTGGDHAEPLTNGDLFASSKSPSLWQKLVKGWLAVRVTRTDVEVRLLTNRPLGAQASTVEGDSFPPLQEIVSRLLTPCRDAVLRGTTFNPPPELNGTWEILKRRAGLTTDFESFVAALRIVPNVRGLRELSQSLVTRLTRLVGDEHEARGIVDTLIHSVVKAASATLNDDRRLDRERLERLLGLSDRRHLKHRHELALPVDYIAFGDMPRRMWEQLRVIDRGYIFVRGVAGSGKTIAVTALLNDHPEIHLRYYTYHPEQKTDRSERVRRTDFYFDLLIQLAERFPRLYRGPRYPSPDGDQNRRTFWSEISRLIREGVAPFVVVIDGLDHAARTRPAEAATFLGTLPAPEDVPAGLKIMLVGQPDWPEYPPWLTDRERVTVIDMPKMSRADISRYLKARADARGDVVSDDSVAELIHQRTTGNPLSVWISVKRLEGLSLSEIARVAEAENFPGNDVHRYYADLWRDIEHQQYFEQHPEHLRRVQALLLTIREPLAAETLAALFATDGLDIFTAVAILKRLKPVLTQEGLGWVVALNDFRVYLQGCVEAVELRDGHARLAKFYRGQGSDASHRNLAHHLYSAGEVDTLLTLLDRGRVRSKLVSGRRHGEIAAELELGWRAAFERRRIEEIYRVGLLLMEEDGRRRVLSGFSVDLDVDEDEKSVEQLLRTFPPQPTLPILETLRERTGMLRAASRLFDRGLRREAEQLFRSWAIAPARVVSAVRHPQGRHYWEEPGEYLAEWNKFVVRSSPANVVSTTEELWLLLGEWDDPADEEGAVYRAISRGYLACLSAIVSILNASVLSRK